MITKVVEEDGLKFRVPDPEEYGSKYDAPVFFNPFMEKDRIMSAGIVGKCFAEKEEVRVADCLSGCGSRALHYARLKNCTVLANDWNPKAIELIEENARINGLEEKVKISKNDARVFLLEERPFDVVDIDPFGYPIQFIPSAVSCLRGKGSMVFLSATDTGALSGSFGPTLMRRYGVRGVRTSFYPELGVRNLAFVLLRAGASEDASFKVFNAYAREHYYRVFARLESYSKTVNRSMSSSVGYYEYCRACEFRRSTPFSKSDFIVSCPVCSKKLEVIGPTFIGRLWEEGPESLFDMPFVDLHALSKVNGLPAPSTQGVINALEEEGFRACKSPFTGKGVLSNACFEDFRRVFLEHQPE